VVWKCLFHGQEEDSFQRINNKYINDKWGDQELGGRDQMKEYIQNKR
jgi:hypothetical protein